MVMTKQAAIKLLVNATYSDEWQGNEDLTAAHNMAIEALEMVEEFEKAQIITGGRLNGRTYAYKCGLEDGKRKTLGQEKYYKDLAQSYEKTIVKLNEAIAEQHSEDCVSRQAVLERINDWWGITATSGEPSLCDYIRELPPVTPTQRWIPVSERLPESAGVYIVTREFTDGFECADLTDACYFDGTSTWHNDNRINHGREYVDKKIKAWMPLPEPYKAGSEV